MPYSMDSDENQRNAQSPSPLMSMHEQLIYKIAALDASMQSGFRRLDEKMDRFQTDLHDNQIETNDRINRLESETTAHFLLKRQRIDALEKRMGETETWQKIAVARTAGAMGIVTVFWLLFGRFVQDLMVGVVN